MRTVVPDSYVEVRDAVSHDVIRLLDQLGATPVLIPNALRDCTAYLEKIGARGLLLTGGNDVEKSNSNHDPGSAERDKTEAELLATSLDRELPVFGICRGLQFINKYFGGEVVPDVAKLSPLVGDHVNAQHEVQLLPDTPYSISGVEMILTNSFHTQGVGEQGLATDLTAFGVASGGVVEGLFHGELDIVAVQWHPERGGPSRRFDRRLLDDWLARCG